MIRTLRYLLLGLLALCLLTVAMANRAVVTVKLLPAGRAALTGIDWQIDMPLFLVIFAGIAAGLLIGFFWEWAREHKHRAAVVRERREKSKLATEVKKLKADKPEGKDEILALVDRKPAV